MFVFKIMAMSVVMMMMMIVAGFVMAMSMMVMFVAMSVMGVVTIYRNKNRTKQNKCEKFSTHFAPLPPKQLALTPWASQTLRKKIAMGISASRRKSQVLVVGLDAAGKTSLLYKLKPKKVEMTIPTIGFNVEHAELSTGCELINIDAWDVGGRDKLRPLWRHFYADKQAVIFVIDSNDRERFPEVKDEIRKIYQEDQLSELPMLIFANKQDLPHAARASELVEVLELQTLRQKWQIFESSCLKNQGIQDGMAWLLSAIHGVPMGSTETAAATATKDGSDVSTVASEGERTP